MKRLLTSCCAALLSAAPLAAKVDVDIDGAKPGVWTMDLKAAKAMAAEKDLPLFINFTGSDWCGWCILMDKEVFSKEEWQNHAKENLMLVWIDFPQDKKRVPEKYVERNKKLAEENGVKGYPTYIVLNSDGKTRLGDLGASRDATPEKFIKQVNALTDKRAKKETEEAAPEPDKAEAPAETE